MRSQCWAIFMRSTQHIAASRALSQSARVLSMTPCARRLDSFGLSASRMMRWSHGDAGNRHAW